MRQDCLFGNQGWDWFCRPLLLCPKRRDHVGNVFPSPPSLPMELMILQTLSLLAPLPRYRLLGAFLLPDNFRIGGRVANPQS